MHDLARKVASRYKTAGEVRFIKDRSDDTAGWGWGTPGPSEREIGKEFTFNPKNLKPLAKTLRASLAALGHVQSAYSMFTKLKSATVSPDGSLGGKGYIAKITDMRRQYMNISEALSAVTDTLYDEIHAPHWNPAISEQSKRERDEVVNIMEDVDEIRESPKEWAQEEEQEMDEEGQEKGKTSSLRKVSALSEGDQVLFKRMMRAARDNKALQPHLVPLLTKYAARLKGEDLDAEVLRYMEESPSVASVFSRAGMNGFRLARIVMTVLLGNEAHFLASSFKDHAIKGDLGGFYVDSSVGLRPVASAEFGQIGKRDLVRALETLRKDV